MLTRTETAVVGGLDRQMDRTTSSGPPEPPAPFVVALVRPRSVEIVEETRQPLGAGKVRVRTLFSGIGAGTELACYRGTTPFLSKRWDGERRLFVPIEEQQGIPFPLTSWGYEEVGEVVEVAPGAGLAVGAVVYGTWGHRSEAVLDAAFARERLLPPGTDPLLGLYSHVGPIALNGVLDTGVRLGETVAVFGLGVVGQLVAQLLRLAGVHVIGVDGLAQRRATARDLGLEVALDAAEPVAERIKDLTAGRGADVCVEASGSTRALNEAIRACAYASRVVVLGFYQGEAQGLFLGEELHHNRVSLVCSQIGGVAPELQHRWDRLRLVRTFMELAVRGAVSCTALITHRVPVAEAASIYRAIDEHPETVLQAVLDFQSVGPFRRASR